jgi:hypothetical protein
MRPSQEWRQTRLATSCRIFSGAALEWAPQKIYCRARPRHSRKIVEELLRDCGASLEALRQTRPSPSAGFLRVALRWSGNRRDLLPGQAASLKKKIMRSCVIVNASLAGGARLGLQRAAGIFERRCFALGGHRRDQFPSRHHQTRK